MQIDRQIKQLSTNMIKKTKDMKLSLIILKENFFVFYFEIIGGKVYTLKLNLLILVDELINTSSSQDVKTTFQALFEQARNYRAGHIYR